MEPRVPCRNPRKTSRVLLQCVLRPDSPTMTREQSCTRLHHTHRDLTSLAPHERLSELPVIPREKSDTGAAAGENPRDAPSSRDEGLFSCLARKTIPSHLSKLHRRLHSLYATQWAPRDTRRHSTGEQSPFFPLKTRPDSPLK